MFYLHCLIYLKKASYLPNLCAKIQGNIDFCIRLLAFLKHIIKCFINDNAFFNAFYYAYLDTYETNTTKDFIA